MKMNGYSLPVQVPSVKENSFPQRNPVFSGTETPTPPNCSNCAFWSLQPIHPSFLNPSHYFSEHVTDKLHGFLSGMASFHKSNRPKRLLAFPAKTKTPNSHNKKTNGN